MVSRIKHFLQSIDVAQVLLCLLLSKLLITSSVSYAEALIVLGLMSAISFKYYVLNVKLKPLAEDTKKELQELKSRVSKFENDQKQHQAQVKPPTQRIWG